MVPDSLWDLNQKVLNNENPLDETCYLGSILRIEFNSWDSFSRVVLRYSRVS